MRWVGRPRLIMISEGDGRVGYELLGYDAHLQSSK